jgi:hypothetical protein
LLLESMLTLTVLSSSTSQNNSSVLKQNED